MRFTDNSGQVRMRKRPEISLIGVTVLDGGLGPMPKSENNVRAVAAQSSLNRHSAIDDTPDYSREAEQVEELLFID